MAAEMQYGPSGELRRMSGRVQRIDDILKMAGAMRVLFDPRTRLSVAGPGRLAVTDELTGAVLAFVTLGVSEGWVIEPVREGVDGGSGDPG